METYQETYRFNKTFEIKPLPENVTLTVRSSPGLEPFYLGAALVAMTNARLFLDFSQAEAISQRLLRDAGTLEELYSFDAFPSPEALAEAQGVARGDDAGQPATDFWPEGESVEDFIEAAMEGRYEEEDEPDS